MMRSPHTATKSSLHFPHLEKAHAKRRRPSAAKTGGGGLVAKSCPTLSTPWTAACQAPLSMGFTRQKNTGVEYFLLEILDLPFPSQGELPDPGIEPKSPALQADSLSTELQGKP